MSTRTVADSLARPIRTGMQATPALIITEGIDAFVWDMADRQYGVMVGLLTIAIGAAQNLYEDWKGKAFLREMPAPPTPITDEETPSEQ